MKLRDYRSLLLTKDEIAPVPATYQPVFPIFKFSLFYRKKLTLLNICMVFFDNCMTFRGSLFDPFVFMTRPSFCHIGICSGDRVRRGSVWPIHLWYPSQDLPAISKPQSGSSALVFVFNFCVAAPPLISKPRPPSNIQTSERLLSFSLCLQLLSGSSTSDIQAKTSQQYPSLRAASQL